MPPSFWYNKEARENTESQDKYLALEAVEDSFLSRNYGSDTGELYKPDSMSFGGGRGNGKEFNMDDFDFGNSDKDGNTETDFGQQGDIPQMPGGDAQQGEIPQMPGGGQDFDFSQIPDGFGQGGMPQRPDGQDGNFDFSQIPDGGQSFDFSQIPSGDDQQGEMPQTPGDMGGGFGSRGSDDVKLRYIDDDPDSYSNIFDNAKTDISSADEKRLISALRNLSEYTDLENTLDIDEVLRYFVVHNFVVNGDSYTGSMIHNYYLHEKDGRLGMIPWDYNLAFGTFQGGSAASSVNDSIDEVLSDRPMQAWIFSDEAYTEQYHALFAEFIEQWFTDGELEKLIADTADMIRPYVEKDPTKFCTADEFEDGASALFDFVTLRAEAVSRQLNGDNTTVDTGDLNLSDMGSMGDTMGGGMDRGFDLSRAGKTQTSQNKPYAPEENELPIQRKNTEGEEKTNSKSDISFADKNTEQEGSRPEGDMSFDPRGESGEISDAAKWISVGVSAAVLAAGLLIAIKKKY